jgi:hypothetical protein
LVHTSHFIFNIFFFLCHFKHGWPLNRLTGKSVPAKELLYLLLYLSLFNIGFLLGLLKHPLYVLLRDLYGFKLDNLFLLHCDLVIKLFLLYLSHPTLICAQELKMVNKMNHWANASIKDLSNIVGCSQFYCTNAHIFQKICLRFKLKVNVFFAQGELYLKVISVS